MNGDGKATVFVNFLQFGVNVLDNRDPGIAVILQSLGDFFSGIIFRNDFDDKGRNLILTVGRKGNLLGRKPGNVRTAVQASEKNISFGDKLAISFSGDDQRGKESEQVSKNEKLVVIYTSGGFFHLSIHPFVFESIFSAEVFSFKGGPT